MAGKGDTYLRYEIHGSDVAGLREAFAEVGMPDSRREPALAIVKEVLAVNDAVDLRWYKTPGTAEIACYWGDHAKNVLWITATEVHVPRDGQLVTRPDRDISWEKADGDYVGWLLPGANRGTGGGKRNVEIATVLCPEHFIRIPANSECPECGVIH